LTYVKTLYIFTYYYWFFPCFGCVC